MLKPIPTIVELTYQTPELVELGQVTELTNYTVSVTAQ